MSATPAAPTHPTPNPLASEKAALELDARKAVELYGPKDAVKFLKRRHAGERQAMDAALVPLERAGVGAQARHAKEARSELYHSLFATDANPGADRARLASTPPPTPPQAPAPAAAVDARLWSALAEQLSTVAASVEASIVLMNRNDFAKRLETMEAIEQKLLARLEELESKLAPPPALPAPDEIDPADDWTNLGDVQLGAPALMSWEEVRDELKLLDAQLVALVRNNVLDDGTPKGTPVLLAASTFTRAEVKGAKLAWPAVATALQSDKAEDWAAARIAVHQALCTLPPAGTIAELVEERIEKAGADVDAAVAAVDMTDRRTASAGRD